MNLKGNMVCDFADTCDVKFTSKSIVGSITGDEVEIDLHSGQGNVVIILTSKPNVPQLRRFYQNMNDCNRCLINFY